MRKLLALALLSLCLPARLSAGQAALWVPAGAAGAEEVLAALETGAALKLTAALPALTKNAEERVKKLEAAGRLELALRPAGDPPLPLLYYPASAGVAWQGKPSTAAFHTDQYFLALRLSLARDAAVKAFKKPAPGLVTPPGGLVADYFPLARALGVRWIACGPAASTAAAGVQETGGVYAVPFVPFSADPYAAAGPQFVLFDETAAADPAALRAALLAWLKAAAPDGHLTVSEALKTAASTAAAPAAIEEAAAPWSGDYSAWASSAVQAGALAALAQTRADLMLHLNAAQGNYAKAAPAFEEYFSAEDGGRLKALASPDPETASETEIELRTSLGNVYRLMGRTPPPWTFSSLADALSAPAQGGDEIQVAALPAGFEFRNVSRPPTPPAATPGLPAAADPGRVWKLSAFAVESGPDGLVFSFTPLALDNSLKKSSGFSHIRLDLYIDINRRPRAGMARPLEGRPLRFFPESAWEYAIAVTPDGASLYRVTPRGPAAAGALPLRTENGKVIVTVPAARLKGSPRLWSYAALLLAPAEAGGFSIADYLAARIENGYIYAVKPENN